MGGDNKLGSPKPPWLNEGRGSKEEKRGAEEEGFKG